MCWWTLRLWFPLNCVYLSAFFCPFSTFFCLFPPLSVLSFLFLSSSILFLSFSAFPYPFYILSYPFSALFCLINSSLPFVILLYPSPHSFYSFLPFRLLYSALFRYLIFPFHILLYSSTAFIFLSLVITSIPFPYLLCIPLINFYLLLFRCSDYSSDVSISL